MLALANFAMRGPINAATVVAVLFLCSSLPVALLGQAGAIATLMLMIGSLGMLSLVVLRQGTRAAVQTAGLASIPVLIVTLLLGGDLPGTLLMLIICAVPILGAATVLRTSVRLDQAMLVLGILAAVGVLLVYLVVGDPAAKWEALLQDWVQSNAKALEQGARETGMSAAELQAQTEKLSAFMARMMTGAMASAMLLVWILALLNGRWLQSRLYNPGGFGHEFHALRFGRGPALAALLVCALSVLTSLPLVVTLAVVAITVFLFQGLAVAHAVVRQRGMSNGWLVGIYAMLVLLHTSVLLSALGMVDNWLNLRAR